MFLLFLRWMRRHPRFADPQSIASPARTTHRSGEPTEPHERCNTLGGLGGTYDAYRTGSASGVGSQSLSSRAGRVAPWRSFTIWHLGPPACRCNSHNANRRTYWTFLTLCNKPAVWDVVPNSMSATSHIRRRRRLNKTGGSPNQSKDQSRRTRACDSLPTPREEPNHHHFIPPPSESRLHSSQLGSKTPPSLHEMHI